MKASELLAEWGYYDVVIFDNPSYDDALIGVTTDGRAAYDYELMVMWLIREYKWSREDAVEWIDYNTLRAIPYYGSAPVVIQTFPE